MLRKYKILHTEASCGWGGQDIRVVHELIAMRARGHEVALCAPVHAQVFKHAKAAGITVYPLCIHKLAYPYTIWWLRGLLKREKFDVINTHSSRDGWIGGIASRLAGTPLSVRSRHIEVDYKTPAINRIAFAKLSDCVITTSDRITERLIAELGLDPDRVSCIASGIDLDKFSPHTPGVLHAELGLDPSVPLVGMVAVLRSWKGHPYMLAAAANVLRRRPDVHFAFAGGTTPNAELQDLVKKFDLTGRVHWLGHREDIPAVLGSLTIQVLSSTGHEGVPQAILQGQACGKAIVATTVGGIPQVITHEQDGLLVPPRDADALSQSILRLLEDEPLRTRLGQAASARARPRYGLDHMCETVEALYAKHLPSSSRSS